MKNRIGETVIILLLLTGMIAVAMHMPAKLPVEYVASQEVLPSELDSYRSVMEYWYKGEGPFLKDCGFFFLDDMLIPGMPKTKESDVRNNYIYSMAQCPQGLCIAEDFFLVTSYSSEDECLGELMVFDRESGRYLVTLGMDPLSHLGGLTFDGKNVWVCNSNEKTLERISYDFVKLMAEENEGDVVDASQVVDKYPIDDIPSCVTYYNGMLWIGTFYSNKNGIIASYQYNHNVDALFRLSEYKAPKKTQGIAFDDRGAIYVSSSYGRKSSSYLYAYDSVPKMAVAINNPKWRLEIPPCSEEIVVGDGILYMLFESAGEKYFEGTDGKGKSDSPIDRILAIELDSVK